MRRAVLLLFLTASAFDVIAGGPMTFEGVRSQNDVRLGIPVFAGDPVGASVSTIFNLQIFETLRVPAIQPRTSGEVYQLPPLEDDVIEESTLVGDAQLVLWGRAFQYAQGTIVQAYLTLPEQRDPDISFQTWNITIPVGKTRHAFEAALPSRDYEFGPIVLPNDVVAKYGELSALNVYKDPAGKAVREPLGPRTFRALGKTGNAIKIVYGDHYFERKEGFILVRDLTALRTEVVDYTSAMIRVLRRDWVGAIEYLDKTLAREETPFAIRIDAHLLRAMCSALMGKSWQADEERARELNPYLDSTTRYGLMLRLWDVSRALKQDKAPGNELQKLTSYLAEHHSYFDKEDPLIVSIGRFIADYSDRTRRTESAHR